MKRPPLLPWLLAVLPAFGCDSLLTKNPASCVNSPEICGPESVCNAETRVCQDRVLGVIGQADLSTNQNLRTGLNAPLAVHIATVSGKPYLFVADGSNNRVLIWRGIPTTDNTPPDVVLGQPRFDTNIAFYDDISASSMSTPTSVTVIDKALVVADSGANRLLIWKDIPIESYRPASYIWGQASTSGTSANRGGGTATTSALGLSAPYVSSTSDYLVVTDSSNHRVLLFAGLPADKNVQPVAVLGQSNFTDNDPSVPSQSGLNRPLGPAYLTPPGPPPEERLLWVSDSTNNRVLGWKLADALKEWRDANQVRIPAPASYVIGQGSFTTNTRNKPSNSAGLYAPAGVHVGRNLLFVADQNNDRVMGYPLANLPATGVSTAGVPATVALGQKDPTMLVAQTVPAATTIDAPRGIAATDTHLAVADSRNNRVLIWHHPQGLDTLASGEAPSVVLGQPLPTSAVPSAPGRLGACGPGDACGLASPRSLCGHGSRMYVADMDNNRVLVWDVSASDPLRIDGAFVLGQAGPAESRRGSGTSGMARPASVSTDGTYLAVADQDNHRVLIWNGPPADGSAAPTWVLGQKDFTTVSSNRGRAAGALVGDELSAPTGVLVADGVVYVADTNNSRVLAWQLPLAGSGGVADYVIGQQDMASNDKQVGPTGLSTPTGLSRSDGGLYVADTGNSRVLRFPLPLQKLTGVPAGGNPNAATQLLGDTLYDDTNNERVAATSLFGPRGVLQAQGILLIADTNNNRVLGWRSVPDRDGAPADVVLGQPNPNTGYLLPNNSALNGQRLNLPYGLYVTPSAYYIADTGNHRILVLSPYL